MLGINKLLAFLRRSVGLRDDAASATGSLHAKVADIATNKVQDIKNVIGTSADNRASNTVMGWLNSPIKSIQRGVTSTPGAGATTNVTISAVTTGKTMVHMLSTSYVGRITNDINGMVFAHLTNTTNLRLENQGGATLGLGGSVSWEIIEYY